MKQKILTGFIILNVIMWVVLSLGFLKFQRDMRELNRLQGVFNEKTIEFFKLINENQSK